MKLKEEFIKLPKEKVYDMYLSLVYDCKNYDNITRGKMLDEIVEEYKQNQFLYAICTERELDFLEYIKHHKLTANTLKKYAWEIKQLNKKCIFSKVTLDVFEEQKEHVKDALFYHNEHKNDKKEMDKIIIFMIGLIKIYANISTDVFLDLITSLTKINKNAANALLGNPLFHFYCEFSMKQIEDLGIEKEIISYREYYSILDDLDYQRKIYGIAGNIPLNIQDNYDIFYYGFPLRNEKVKKMVTEINKRLDKDFLYKIIDEARVLNDRHGLAFFLNNKLLKLVNDALDEMPSAAMNGFTPKDYEKELEQEKNLNEQFIVLPQNNAHLCKNAADLYYKLYFALLDYTNQNYVLNKKIGKIYKQEGLNVKDLYPIDKYLWEHKEIIDEFITKNPNKFDQEELEIIKGFKTAVSSDHFVIVGFDREYTQILSEDGKIYMVKGICVDLDKIINPYDLPKFIRTTLLMFKGNIVFNSFLSPLDITFGNDIRKSILNDYKVAIKYYHL